jgi:hypothetical protein
MVACSGAASIHDFKVFNAHSYQLPNQRTPQLQELRQQLMFKVLCFQIGSELSHGSSTQTFTVAWRYDHRWGVLFHVEDGCVRLNCFLKKIQWTGNNLSSEMEMPQAFERKGCIAIKLFAKRLKSKAFAPSITICFTMSAILLMLPGVRVYPGV